MVQVTSSRYWARVSLFCSTSAAFRRISPTPFPNPPNDSNSCALEQQQLHVNVLIFPGVAKVPAVPFQHEKEFDAGDKGADWRGLTKKKIFYEKNSQRLRTALRSCLVLS